MVSRVSVSVRFGIENLRATRTTPPHMGYSFQLAARVLLYAPSHRKDSTYYSLCYTSCGALAGLRKYLNGSPWGIKLITHCTMSECSYHGATSHKKEGNVLFNDALNTFYLRLYGVRHMVKDHSDSEGEETLCRHIGYSFWLAARVLLYAPSNRQDNTYHGLWYTSREALAGMRNSSSDIRQCRLSCGIRYFSLSQIWNWKP